MLTGVFLGLWVLLILCRGTPFGALLSRAMVERPAAWLSRVGRGHLVGAGVLAIIVGVLALSGGDDVIRMLGMAAPDIVAWLSTVELSVLVDAAVAAAVAWSAVRPAAIRCGLIRASRIVRRGGRAARARRRQVRVARGENDDDGPGGYLLAA